MRKLVLGIIVLVCLDIGFVYYTSMGLQTDLALNRTPNQQVATAPAPPSVSNKATSVSKPPLAENTNDAADVAAVKVRSDNVSNNRESIARLSTQRRAAKAYSRMRERTSPARNQPLFEPVVFYVRRHSATASERLVSTKNSRDVELLSERPIGRHTPKRENKSLVARVWPVIKKPYEWVKIIGSKFN